MLSLKKLWFTTDTTAYALTSLICGLGAFIISGSMKLAVINLHSWAGEPVSRFACGFFKVCTVQCQHVMPVLLCRNVSGKSTGPRKFLWGHLILWILLRCIRCLVWLGSLYLSDTIYVIRSVDNERVFLIWLGSLFLFLCWTISRILEPRYW